MKNLNYFDISDIELLYFTSTLLFLISVGFFVIVMISRKTKSIRIKVRNRVLLACQEFISELVFEDELSYKTWKLEKYFLSSDYKKQVLLEEIINLHKSVKGELATFLEGYFIEKNFHLICLAKIRSKNKYKIIEGLLELSQMNATVVLTEVKEVLRKQKDADMKNHFIEFLIKQDPKEGLKELHKANTYISDWFQIKIVNVLKEKNFIDVPPLSIWLKNGGSHAFFGCRLVAFARVHAEIPELIEILSFFGDDELKIEALRTLTELEAKESIEELTRKYLWQPEIVKKEILILLEKFEGEMNVDLLIKCATSSVDDIRVFSINAISKLKIERNYAKLRTQKVFPYSLNQSIKLVG